MAEGDEWTLLLQSSILCCSLEVLHMNLIFTSQRSALLMRTQLLSPDLVVSGAASMMREEVPATL